MILVILVSSSLSSCNIYLPYANQSHNSTEYQKINDLRIGDHASFFGRVVSFKPARKTSRDYILSLVVVDDSFAGHADITSAMPAGMSVNIFRAELNEFPRVERVGDIVAFRRFKIQQHNGCLQALSTKYSGWTVFRKNGPTSWSVIPLRAEEIISDQQWEVLNAIHALPIGTGGPVAGLVSADESFTGKSFKRPTLLVSELNGGGRFFDIYLKVIEIVNQDHLKCDLLCTDYTQNDLLKTSHFGHQDFLEKSLIRVTLWDSNAEAISLLGIHNGSILFLENVKSKINRSPDGTSYLEAVLHGDKDSNSKVSLMSDADPAARRLNQRAEQVNALTEVDANELAKVIETTGKSPKKSPSKPAFRTLTDASEERNIASSSITTKAVSTNTSSALSNPLLPHTPILSSSQIPRQMATSYTTTIDEHSIKITSLLDIRSYPSEHAKFCTRAHIKALIPAEQWSWVRVRCEACASYTELGVFKHQGKCASCPARDSCNRWIFVFGLVLDDGECDLPVIVAAEDAEHFLGFGADEFGAAEEQEEALLERVISQVQLLQSSTAEHLFCLQSYRVGEGGESSLRYRLLQTRMHA